jgi:hypothetical protein
MNEKYLYLDFDGVLHPNFVGKGQLFSHMEKLTKVVEGKPLRIVISSSWRFHENLDYLRSLFGSTTQSQIVGCTGPAHIGKWPRWNEIKNHAIANGVSDWVALDDAYMEFPSECKELILCDGRAGLQDKQMQQLGKWLTSKRCEW